MEAARARGHEVTLFHRGRTHPDLFPDLEHVRGDRDGGLAPLQGRSWDAALDTSGYVPRLVRDSCELLRDAVGHYTFVSTISVYADSTRPGITETDSLATLPEGASREELTGESYGPLKVLCEREVESVFGGRATIVRAGLIFGPHDLTDRTAYWPLRVAEGGDVLAPGRPERPIQLIDVRDLAVWMVCLAERRIDGTFNATGPESTLTMERFLSTCREVAGSNARFIWLDEPFLLERKVTPFGEMPLWVPERFQAFQTVDGARAFAAGLTCRPLADTVRAALEWARAGGPRPDRAGVPIPPALTREREAEVLSAWRMRGAAKA